MHLWRLKSNLCHIHAIQTVGFDKHRCLDYFDIIFGTPEKSAAISNVIRKVEAFRTSFGMCTSCLIFLIFLISLVLQISQPPLDEGEDLVDCYDDGVDFDDDDFDY